MQGNKPRYLHGVTLKLKKNDGNVDSENGASNFGREIDKQGKPLLIALFGNISPISFYCKAEKLRRYC